jgi:formylglycine-generating enzyme required for sulfatase activity
MRVKVIASDGKGFPGMEWGQEIPAGGFFMGQDGGQEGVGPGKHVNIPWSYWLSKYEITVEQYSEFLNAAISAGLTTRSGDQIIANKGSFAPVPENATIYNLGDDLLWNLNKVSIRTGREKLALPGSLCFGYSAGWLKWLDGRSSAA